MILHVKAARHLHDYVLWVRFNDGAEGEVNLEGELEGEVFEPLKKLSLFRALRVDPLLQTVVWPNEADLAPEFLYEKMRPSACRDQGRPSKSLSLAVREGHGTYAAGRPLKPRALRAAGLNPRVEGVLPEDGCRAGTVVRVERTAYGSKKNKKPARTSRKKT